MDNPEKLTTQGTQDTGQINVREYRRAITNGQSKETDNIGFTRRRRNNIICVVNHYRQTNKKTRNNEEYKRS